MNWAQAFAMQARSDLAARDCLLTHPTLPQCHELQFLQMACEKLCKAYLMNQPNLSPQQFQFSHGYIRKTLPVIARQFLARNKGGAPQHLVGAIARLAGQIELLAPRQNLSGTFPANVEYPWMTPNGIVAPCDHAFGLSLLHEKAGVTLLKLLHIALAEIIDAEESEL